MPIIRDMKVSRLNDKPDLLQSIMAMVKTMAFLMLHAC